jgi:hypothetical protein
MSNRFNQARQLLQVSVFAGAALFSALCGSAMAAQPLQVGGSIQGELRQGDEQLESGEAVDSYLFNGRAGQQVEVRLTSGAFDTYLMMTGPDGFVVENDDDALQPGVVDSRLMVTLPADGTYEILATSYQAGDTGRYELSVADGASGAAREGVGAAAIGDSTGGMLGGGDFTYDDKFVDVWTFEGHRGERVEINVASAAFDTYLYLIPPGGRPAENDDSNDSTNSRIETALEADGQYIVYVTSYGAGEGGSYDLSIAPSAGSERQRAVPAGPRVFGVFVGISDYEGEGDDLPYTADDAVELADTLSALGVLNPASIVLTDSRATRGNVAAAIRKVSGAAGPDDMFVVFFSGHGFQSETTADGEIDGRDESIVLYDGDLYDHELAAMLDGVDARLSLLALDACFSGGFARDVVDRAGIMGLFSSEEDLTSMTADQYEAGGYLAHFLQTAFSGEADLDGDRMLTAGELSAYLRGAFDIEAAGVPAETTDGQRNYQELVVERGAVQVDDVVFRFAPMAMASSPSN